MGTIACPLFLRSSTNCYLRVQDPRQLLQSIQLGAGDHPAAAHTVP